MIYQKEELLGEAKTIITRIKEKTDESKSIS